MLEKMRPARSALAILSRFVGRRLLPNGAQTPAAHPAAEDWPALLDGLADAFLVVDQEWRIRYLNAAAARLLNTGREEATGADLWTSLASFHGSQVEKDLRRAMTDRVAVRFEAFYAPASLWLEVHAYPCRTGLAIHVRDFTERKLAEDAIRISEAKFAGIVSIAADAIISLDRDQRIILFNEGAETIFGYTKEEVLGQPLDILLPERFRRIHRQHVVDFARSGVTARRMAERSEIVGLRKNGEEFPAEASISRLEVEGETIFSVVLRDITTRKRVEEAQRFLAEASPVLTSSLERETILKNLVRLTVPRIADWCVVYTVEPDGSVRLLEKAHEDPVAEGRAVELGRYWLDPETPYSALKVLTTGTPELVGDLLARGAGGEAAPAILRELGVRSFMVVPVVARGTTFGAIAFIAAESGRRYDADDLRIAEELAWRTALAVDNARLYREAQQAVRARDHAVSVVSHDLGNPLSAIIINTRLLLKQLPAETIGGAARELLEAIRTSAEQMRRLIQGLLEVRRIEAGRLVLDRRMHRVAPILEEVGRSFESLAAEKAIRFEVAPAGDLPQICADRERLFQVFSNLVGNAIKFTPAGGRVQVAAEACGEHEVRFSVADTGPGIPESQLPYVFDRFWQARPVGEFSVGLGLAIARGIVEAHGGRIWVETAEGQGSTFSFTIPTTPPREELRWSLAE